MSESNLEDRAAIHDLFTRYCCALDNGEVEAVVEIAAARAWAECAKNDLANPRSGRRTRLASGNCCPALVMIRASVDLNASPKSRSLSPCA
jgi:hypothetical protein